MVAHDQEFGLGGQVRECGQGIGFHDDKGRDAPVGHALGDVGESRGRVGFEQGRAGGVGSERHRA